MEIIFATSNKHKLFEAKGILGKGFSLKTPADFGITEEIPEEGATLEQNALFKAQYIFQKTGSACFADDTGLETETLYGAPGVKSARYASPECDSAKNIDKLLKELKYHTNTKARFKTVVAFVSEKESCLFEGILNGKITFESAGVNGFGYDPVFIPENYTKTLAELSNYEKNLISHRALALRKLADFLRKSYR